MRTKLLAVGGVVLLLAGAAGAVLTGFGPASGGDSGSDVESFPTETPAERTTDSGGADSAETTATATPPFGFTIDDIENCGQTCRDVTSTLTNQQDTTATDVTVYTRIYAGNGTDGDVVWEGSEPVGTLDAGESYTATKRVELSYSEALAIENEDGWITVQTTVQSDDRTVTFTDQRQVA
ncbi:hypothetical protein EGH21_14105 [Halomicroarcula sp. F13]|uniref:Uncharacterized protein n=1 Tax=Haloarcula rubra TaxID=2487747 RepID=A0AAW4PSP9_9EURY|nr:hypothetical protein [Halomicroarcula rubra]MBX0324167.1 hypothetical protein [Halomicroarcula rubra]